MSFSIYQASVPVFIRMLGNLSAILAKAEAHAQARSIEPTVLLNARLAPDMHPLSFQIQSATDRSKLWLARVSGVPAPSWADDEKTFEEIKARLQKGLDFAKAITPAQLDGLEDKLIPLKIRGEDVQVPALTYLNTNAIPNFYFHVTTAYDLLRHAGVPVGKRDFTG